MLMLQVEDWRLVSMPSPDYALMLWCGRLPVLDYAGGIVISKHRDIETINIKTHIKGGFTKIKEVQVGKKLNLKKIMNCETVNPQISTYFFEN